MPDNQFAAPVPGAVKATASKADELQAQFIKQLNGETPPAEEETPEEEAQANGEAQPEVEEPPPDTPPPVEEAPPEGDDEGTWRHRYDSMRGRYNAEVPKLRGQVKELADRVGNLNKLLATVTKPEAPPLTKEQTFQSSIKPEEIAEYGPEFMDLVGRIVKDTTAAQTAEIAQLKDRLKTVGGQIGASARQSMMTQLATVIPNWEEINTHQEFLDWLALPDAYSGDIRHNLLMTAFERNDAPRVIAFFKGFLAEMAVEAPPDAEPGRKITKTPLRNLAAPGRAKSAAAPNGNAPAEKPIFTASQIAKFYTDLGLGKWRGREKEAKEFETQIFAAQAEGRIR